MQHLTNNITPCFLSTGRNQRFAVSYVLGGRIAAIEKASLNNSNSGNRNIFPFEIPVQNS